jgi:hypothetical protein
MKFELESIPKHLVRVTEPNAQGLKVVKYSKKVFYNNLWDTHPLIKECRGLVLDADNNIVSHPFTKVFNIGENGTSYPAFPFMLVEKINGFMGTITMHQGMEVFSTTGSLDSDFVSMWQDSFRTHWVVNNDTFVTSLELDRVLKELTLVFEVCHSRDPHIVKEELGIYLIGARRKANSRMLLEIDLDLLANNFNWKRPKYYTVKNLKELNKLVDKCKMEGFMVRDYDGHIVAKVKSNHYLGLKFLGRCGAKKAERLWNMDAEGLFKIGLDEDFLPVVTKLRERFTEQEWLAFSEQERIAIVAGTLEN